MDPSGTLENRKTGTLVGTYKNRNFKAAEKFHVAVKQIREWRQNELKIFLYSHGDGKKPQDLQLENQLVESIYNRRFNRLRVNLSRPRQNVFTKVNLMKARNIFLWQATGGSTISCVVMVFRYFVKQQHSKIQNG